MPQSNPCKSTSILFTLSHTQSNHHSIRKNAATSPLLLLPSEVRENILIHLLGDKFIHIKYLDDHDLWHANQARNEHSHITATEAHGSEQSPSHAVVEVSDDDDEDDDIAYLSTASAMMDRNYNAVFRHAICVATQSEQSAYDAFVSGDADIPEGESPEHYVAPCRERHVACNMCGDGPMYLLEEDRPALSVDLNVLGVCRQLYEEGNHLLWATNTFSFDDPRTFGKFFGSLNPAQKRKLTKLHISADMRGLSVYHTTASQRARYDKDYWGTALKIANLNMLRGVQTLHLCLNQDFVYVSSGSAYSADRSIESTQEPDMEIFLRLRALSTRHVTVIISDEPHKHCSWSDLRWTTVKKTEYGESIRARLLDANGFELVKAEAEVATLARKVEMRNNAADRLKSYKSILKERRADRVRTANWASREEAKARVAARNLTRPSSKSSKTPSKGSWRKGSTSQKVLKELADKSEEAALDARAVADRVAGQVEFWQQEVANAREKLKRAMAILGATPEGKEYEEELEKVMESSSGSEVDIKSEDTDDEIYYW